VHAKTAQQYSSSLPGLAALLRAIVGKEPC
jgi:hypothetical protein